MTFLRDALLVAGKDLRIERRSRVALQQIVPFGAIVVVLFAFALDSDPTLLRQAAPGLFWAAVLLAVLLAVGRSFSIEEANRARETLVPLLVLPAVMPVMLGATRSFQAALAGTPGDAWPWVQLLIAFAVLAVTAGTVAFGPLLEEA
jgi:ABC-type transport system involved in cytochrome c biogenesis permease component